MADLPEISDKAVDAFARAFNTCSHEGQHPLCCTRAGLAAVLVASGYRREADVLREAADHFAANWYAREQSVLIARELRNLADMGRATALDPAQPLPVAAVEGQERSEEPVMVPCECPDPRCTNRIAALLVGDEESSRG